MLDLSIIIPICNERENIRPLVEDVLREASALDRSFEVILVNDGSTDGSSDVLDDVASAHDEVRVVHFVRNAGQTLAIAAGWTYAAGDVIVLLDGDRQNDPADIGRLLDKLDEGYACVSGWRKDRHDSGLRRLLSRVANRIIRRLSSVPLHDLGCTLKAYRHDALDPRELLGEMHRFLPLYVHYRGGRVTEMVVRHHPRVAGESKYGIDRTGRVLSDLFFIRMLMKYRTRPSHLFARISQYMALSGVLLLVLGIAGGVVWSGGLAVAGFLAMLILGVGAMLMLGAGWTCELVTRSLFAQGDAPPWQVERLVNMDRSTVTPSPRVTATSVA